MSTSAELNHKTLRDEFKVLIAANDAHAFIGLCQTVKAETMTLISADRCNEANQLMEVYANIFRLYTCENPAFTLKILPLMPPDANSTLRLLGINDEIDSFILEHKANLNVVCQAKDNAYQHLIEWALSKHDMACVERIVLKIAECLHDAQAASSHFSKVSCSILYSLFFFDDTRTVACTPAMDEAIASMINDNRGLIPKEDDYFLMMANTGLPKSLMKALELQSFCAEKITRVENRQTLFAALPENPTAQQLFWVFRSIEVDGIEEQILFDERIDINEHIEVLRSSSHIFNDLSSHTLERFSHLFNIEIQEESKNRRAVTFLNAICEEERDRPGRERSAEDIHNELIDLDIAPALIRQVKMLRGLALEDALGL